MIVDYEAVLQFVLANSKRKEKGYLKFISETMEKSRPIFDSFTPWRWKYKIENLDHQEIVKAIHLATDKMVDKIIPFMGNQQFFKPEWLPDKVYKNSLKNKIFGNSLRDYLGVNFENNVDNNLGGNFQRCLWDNFGRFIGENLGFWPKNHPWNAPISNFIDSIWVSNFYFIGFLMAGDIEKVERLVSLIQIQAKGHIPLAFTGGKLNAVFILVG